MTELRSHPHLTLAEHLDQIRCAARAIWSRHSPELLFRCADARKWFDDAVCLHDTGKASQAFQHYIVAPDRYRGPKHKKAHTPLSTVFALLHGSGAGWDWRRTLAVAQIAAGHHSEFKTHQDLDNGMASMDAVIGEQISGVDWDALDRAVGLTLPRLNGRDGTDVVCEASDRLGELVEQLHRLYKEQPTHSTVFRLMCQLAFSILLEADKAFLAVPEKDLPHYLAPRSAELPPMLVEQFIARKSETALDHVRRQARTALFAGIAAAGDAKVQTMTLPTGTGKTLLAASWTLTLREQARRAGSPAPLVLIVLPYLAIIDQTADEYQQLFKNHVEAGELVTYHSLSDRTFAPDLEEQSQDFFLDTWQSNVVITTFDQFLLALLSPKARHQMRFHHLADALIVMDEVQALPCILWHPLQKALEGLTAMGNTRVLAMSATQPGFVPAAHELIHRPQEDFFQQMNRYRLVLRQREPMKLSAFVEECKQRLPDWKGKRVLLTLNTRRSAKAVRDALEAPARENGLPLEFLSADVTPADRLVAIRRIKTVGPRLVVSTQCIEAGVDIDMGFVVRDFAPLDSLIQVAGRCNRNGSRPRDVVEVVQLVDDERPNRALASYVYDPIQLQVTHTVLADLITVDEESIFPLTRRYFAELSQRKDTGEAVTQAWLRWEDFERSVRDLLRGTGRPQVAFVVIGQDPSLRDELDTARNKPDRWDRRRALRQIAGRIARITVSVYDRKDFDPSDYALPYPAEAMGDKVWFWLLKDKFYTSERGIDLGRTAHTDDSWGMII